MREHRHGTGWIVVATLALVATLVAAGARVDGAAPKAPVKVGMTSAITGAYSEYGDGARRSAMLALEQWNARGGVAGHPVELVVYDDQLTANKAVTNTLRLLNEDKINAFLFPAGSTPAMAVLPLIVKSGVPAVNLVATSDKVVYPKGTGTPPYPNVFNFALQNDVEAQALAAYLGKHWKKVGLLTESSEYGQTAGENIKKFLKAKSGLDLVRWEQYDQKTPDVTAQLGRLREAGAEVVAMVSLGADCATIRKNLDRMGWNAPMVGTKGIFGVPYQELAGDLVIGSRGTMLTSFLVDPAHFTPTQKGLALAWKKRWGNDRYYGKGEWPVPEFSLQAYAYDAVNAILTAMDRAGGPDPKGVIEQMNKLKEFPGGLGSSYTFTSQVHHALTVDLVGVAEYAKRGDRIVVAPAAN